MTTFSSRRTFLAQLCMGLSSLAIPLEGWPRPISRTDTDLGPNEVGKKHEQYVMASQLIDNNGRYRIHNRLVNNTSRLVRIEYLAALLVDVVPAKEAVDDVGNDLIVAPITSSLVPGHPDTVNIYASNGRLITTTTADAYLPTNRIIKKGMEGLPKGIEWLLEQGERVIRIIKSYRGLNFISETKPASNNRVSYTYRVENSSSSSIYFEWTSALDPKTNNGWRDRAIARESARTFTVTEAGPPILINDVVVFNSEAVFAFPTLKNLKGEPSLSRRAEDIAMIPKTNISSIVLAPAIIPGGWVGLR
jgi:hypothetical protein